MTSDLPLQGVAIYNPHLLSKDELVEQFIARRPLLERIIQDLRSDARPEHRLLVGPRGMGKTTLLRRLYFAIEDDPVLAAVWLPLAFPEEQYSISSLSDLYLNCVDALSDTLDRMGRREAAAALDRARDALPARDEAARAKGALRLLLQAADDLKRKLVLLVDNIEMVLDRLQNERAQWKVRELLSTEPRLLLIGASVAASNDSFEHGAAFYNFFRAHELRPLAEEEAKEVLLHLSDVCKTPAVARVVREEPERVQTIRTLAGGNPRTLVQLYTVLAQSTEGNARSDLEHLLDQCTPLYKARFEALSPQAQKIVDALAHHWHPMTAAELSSAARLDSNVVSSQLTRLMREGVVEAVGTPAETKAAYQVAERFFNIWYLMRASRRVRQRLVWLVEFLRLFYGHGLGAHARSRIGSSIPNELSARMREAEYRIALADAVDSPHLRRALFSSAVQPIVESRKLRERIAEIVSLEEEDKDLRPIVDKHLAAAEVREKVLEAKVTWDGWDAERFADLLGGSMSLSRAAKRGVADNLDQLSKDQIDDAIVYFEQERSRWARFCHSDDDVGVLCRAFREGYIDELMDLDDVRAASVALNRPELWPLVLSALALRQGGDPSLLLPRLEDALNEAPYLGIGWYSLGEVKRLLGQTQGAVLAFQRAVKLDEEDVDAWRAYARALSEAEDLKGAEAAFRRAIELGVNDAKLWDDYGDFLDLSLDRLHDAERAYRKAIELDPSLVSPWCGLGYVLRRRHDRHHEAEEAYRRAVALEPANGYALSSLGFHLHHDRHRYDEAEEAYRKALELDPDSAFAWEGLGDLLYRTRGQHSDAEESYRRAIALNPKLKFSWLGLGDLYGNLRRWIDAEHAFRKAIEIDPQYVASWAGLAWSRYLANKIDDETEDAARRALGVGPLELLAKHILAIILVRRGKWDEPRSLASDFLTQVPEQDLDSHWSEIVLFFAETVRAGRTADALRLLEEVGIAERWLPLRAALEAMRDGRARLLVFAPEVRATAEKLVAEFERLSGVTATPIRKTDQKASRKRRRRT